MVLLNYTVIKYTKVSIQVLIINLKFTNLFTKGIRLVFIPTLTTVLSWYLKSRLFQSYGHFHEVRK